MKLKSLFSLFSVGLIAVALSLSSAPVEAKRLGGGMNFGKSYGGYARQAKPPAAPAGSQQAKPGSAAGASQAGTPRRGGFLGPIMGLAAGGLLAAMFFGGAFEGINFFDILLIGGLIFGGMALLRSMRRPSGHHGAGQYREAPASGPSAYHSPEPAPAAAAGSSFSVPEIGSGLKGEPLSVQPAWFNELAFMSEVKNHFHALHRAWEARDLDEIRNYTTPSFFAYLQQELSRQPEHAVKTEVVNLDAQLLDLLQDGDKVVAAILFRGTERASGQLDEDFAEIWHVEHPADSADGDWALAGIQQMS